MKPRTRAHLQKRLKQIRRMHSVKYVRGAREHNGDLMHKPATELIDDILDESVDLIFYGLELKDRLKGMKAYVDRIESGLAVVLIEDIGELHLRVRDMPFAVREGMQLKIGVWR